MNPPGMDKTGLVRRVEQARRWEGIVAEGGRGDLEGTDGDDRLDLQARRCPPQRRRVRTVDRLKPPLAANGASSPALAGRAWTTTPSRD